MKKLLFIALLIFTPTLSTAQLSYDVWETVETVDDFGDPTGEKIIRTFGKGTFSNSATANSKLIVKFSDYYNGAMLEMYEYERPPGADFDNNFGLIKVKRENGDIETYEAFAPDTGGLYFKEGSKFLGLVRNGNKERLKIVVDESDFTQYGQSRYTFSFITQ